MSISFDAQCMQSAKTVQDKFSKQLLRLATAESCTGGLLASYLTAHGGSSQFYEGGVNTYSNASKCRLLKVDDQILAEHGAVSMPVCKAMAAGALALFDCSYALAVTGIAGPGGATPDKPVGTVFVGLGSPQQIMVKRLQLSGDRRNIRVQTCLFALEWLAATVTAETTQEFI